MRFSDIYLMFYFVFFIAVLKVLDYVGLTDALLMTIVVYCTYILQVLCKILNKIEK